MDAGVRECVVTLLVEIAGEAESRGDNGGYAATGFAIRCAFAVDVDNATFAIHALRKSSRMRLKSAGRSAIALCAASGMTTSREFAMVCASACPCCTGTSGSSSPHTMSVGHLM